MRSISALVLSGLVLAGCQAAGNGGAARDVDYRAAEIDLAPSETDLTVPELLDRPVTRIRRLTPWDALVIDRYDLDDGLVHTQRLPIGRKGFYANIKRVNSVSKTKAWFTGIVRGYFGDDFRSMSEPVPFSHARKKSQGFHATVETGSRAESCLFAVGRYRLAPPRSFFEGYLSTLTQVVVLRCGPDVRVAPFTQLLENVEIRERGGKDEG